MLRMMRPVHEARMWEHATTKKVKPAPNWYVQYSSRTSNPSRYELAKKSVKKNPDLKSSNVVKIREDYELTPEGWQPPIVSVEALVGVPTKYMKISLRCSYQWIRTLKFDNDFSSVFSLLQVATLLKNCRNVSITLSENNVQQSEADKNCDPAVWEKMLTKRSSNVRSVTITKPSLNEVSKRWMGKTPRLHLIIEYAYIVFHMLERLNMDAFGDTYNFEIVHHYVHELESYPDGYRTHDASFNGNSIVVKPVEEEVERERTLRSYKGPAPPVPMHMESKGTGLRSMS